MRHLGWVGMVQVVFTGHRRYCIVCMVCMVCICTRGSECKWFEVHRWYSCRHMANTRSHMVVLVVQYNLHKISASLGLGWNGPSSAYRQQSVLHLVHIVHGVHLHQRERMQVV